MPRVKITKRWLRARIAEEEESAQDYAKHGLIRLAGQERMHAQFLRMLLRRMEEERDEEIERNPVMILRSIV